MSLQNTESEKMASTIMPPKGSWFLLLIFYNRHEFYNCILLQFVF